MAMVSSKVLSEVEHSELQKFLTFNEKTAFRDTTFIWTLLHTGARVSEVLAICGRDLVFEGQRLFVRGLKNSLDRELPLTAFLFNRLKVLATDPDGKIFPFTYSNARLIWKHYRPGKKKIHSMRHYRAFEIYRKHKDVRLVQKVLGHRSLMTTLIYTDYDYTAEELRRAML